MKMPRLYRTGKHVCVAGTRRRTDFLERLGHDSMVSRVGSSGRGWQWQRVAVAEDESIRVRAKAKSGLEPSAVMTQIALTKRLRQLC